MCSCRVGFAAELVRRWLRFSLIGLLACQATEPPPEEKPPERRVVQQSPDEPGRRVSIGARAMYIECAGEGFPTVVFDAGLGGSARNWEGVVAGVRRETRACRYDRLGTTGRSDAAPRPHSPVDMALELNELLAAAGEQPPLVLVGHSLGGINARLYVQNNPGAVVGLVLVESMHEDQEQRVGALAQAVQQQRPAELEANGEGLTSESLASGLNALRRGERSLGTRALVVISRGVPPPALPGLSEEITQRMWAERQALQAELAQLSSNSVQVIAEQSGHAVLRDQPQLVVDATLEVVRAVRQGRRVQREPMLPGAAPARP